MHLTELCFDGIEPVCRLRPQVGDIRPHITHLSPHITHASPQMRNVGTDAAQIAEIGLDAGDLFAQELECRFSHADILSAAD